MPHFQIATLLLLAAARFLCVSLSYITLFAPSFDFDRRTELLPLLSHEGAKLLSTASLADLGLPPWIMKRGGSPNCGKKKKEPFGQHVVCTHSSFVCTLEMLHPSLL